ncbi:protein-glutamate methyltransferase [Amylibacter marinus]|uniref:Protein-glutamate methyltransferase n=1 Tax=Amylibacter marinus TaxID=1475483 RepID=A0ABQ5VVN4_9RHOB|nr:lipopolysaccharide transport periplasmic protein LptA [Amylibacter marinus]GLQ35498.1 protein-glutamate methyltransferase [Amylibacter marinus]
MKNLFVSIFITSACISGLAYAQGASLSLSSTPHDASQPVEVTADSLTVDQASRTAVFSGSARVGQGAMRLGADQIQVTYSDTASEISKVSATGSVVFTNGAENAEADRANYDVAKGLLIMQGNVLLLQGGNAFSADTLELDVLNNSANLTGNVKTVLVPK